MNPTNYNLVDRCSVIDIFFVYYMSLPSNIMFCGLVLTVHVPFVNNTFHFEGPPYMPASQTYMYYPLKVEGIVRPNLTHCRLF